MNTTAERQFADWTPFLTEESPLPYLLKVDMARAFVRALYAPYERGWVNVRCLQKHKGKAPCFGRLNRKTMVWTWEEWFPLAETVADPDDLIGFAFAAESQRYDVYVGVLPRGKHGEAKKSSIYEGGMAWAELDFDKQEGGEAATLTKAEDAFPDILVYSGGGLHLYWTLKTPVPMTGATMTAFEKSLKVQQRGLGADPTHDVTRILRLPGTTNYKREIPRPVRLLKCQ